MSKTKVTFKILVLLILSDCLETLTQLCFKKSALPQSGFMARSLLDVYLFLKPIFLSPYLWIGFLSVFLTFIIWATILSKIDLSIAVPIASFSYILVPLASILFLHEEVSFLDWSGILFIITGVVFVSKSTGQEEIDLK